MDDFMYLTVFLALCQFNSNKTDKDPRSRYKLFRFSLRASQLFDDFYFFFVTDLLDRKHKYQKDEVAAQLFAVLQYFFVCVCFSHHTFKRKGMIHVRAEN